MMAAPAAAAAAAVTSTPVMSTTTAAATTTAGWLGNRGPGGQKKHEADRTQTDGQLPNTSLFHVESSLRFSTGDRHGSSLMD
jgi:hypothetical protein